jgi:hypothetical protein
MLFESSDVPTLSVTITAASTEDIELLADALDSRGYGFEPLASGQMLCRCCSEGTVEKARARLSGSQVCLIAAPIEDARATLDEWREPAVRDWQNLHVAA